ncbi:MAG: THUMP domain-containing protein [SAR324 cluster bacterium]|nr:THUMP domain-containing protein [SAR324 cluster bacterium]
MKEPHLRKQRERPRHLYFVPVPRGLEPVLLAEMEALGLPEAHGAESGAFFRGTLEDCYRANLWLRTGARVLRILAEFPCTDEQALYRETRKLDWFRLLSPDQTLAVRARLGHTAFTHAQYLSRKIKDGIVDQFSETFGRRPSVDARAPHLQVHAWFHEGRCSLSVDSSGEPLFKRGYRTRKGEAPLRETLAAGLIGLTGWTGQAPFCDFMTGSGTLAVEAALIATGRAPGLTREWFGFMNWPDFQRSLWNRLRAEARGAIRPAPAPILASDRDERAIAQARHNAEAAGVAEAIRFAVGDFRDVEPCSPASGALGAEPENGRGAAEGPSPATKLETDPVAPGTGPSTALRTGPAAGIVLVNPPYGERMGKELPGLYAALGDVLKQRYKGWEAYVFTVQGELIKSIGLRPSRRTILYNGALECRLLQYRMY